MAANISVPFLADAHAVSTVVAHLERWCDDRELSDVSDRALAHFRWLRESLIPGLEWAASFGVAPLPTFMGRDGSPGKHVAIEDWKSFGSLLDVWRHRDPSQLSGWCFQPGSCVLPDSRLMVVDIDSPEFESLIPGSFDAKAALLLVRSGSYDQVSARHKVHLYFRFQQGPSTDVKPAFGADWLCDQQVVLGPGSKHRSGRLYSWASGEAPALSAADLPLLACPSFEGSQAVVSGPGVVGRKGGLGSFCPPGASRNEWTNAYLYKSISELVRMVHPKATDLAQWEDQIRAQVLAAWERSPDHDWVQFRTEYDLDKEIQDAWDEALRDRRNMRLAACEMFRQPNGEVVLKYQRPVPSGKGGQEWEDTMAQLGTAVHPFDEIYRVEAVVDPYRPMTNRSSVRVRLRDTGEVVDLSEALVYTPSASVDQYTDIKAQTGMALYKEIVPHVYGMMADSTSFAVPSGFWLVRAMEERLRRVVPDEVTWLFVMPSGVVHTNVGVWDRAPFVPIRGGEIAPDHTFTRSTFVTKLDSLVDADMVRRAARLLTMLHHREYIVPLCGYYTAAVLLGWFKDVLKVNVPHLGVMGATETGKSTYASAGARELHGIRVAATSSQPMIEVSMGLARAGCVVLDDHDTGIRKLTETIFRSGYDSNDLSNTKRSNPAHSRIGMLAEDLEYVTSNKANSRRCLVLSPSSPKARPSYLGLKSQAQDYNDLDMEDVCRGGSELWVQMLLEVIKRVDVKRARTEFFFETSESEKTNVRVVDAGVRIFTAAALDYQGDPFDPDWDPVIQEPTYPHPPIKPLEVHVELTDMLQANVFVQAVKAWVDDYPHRYIQQWGWTETYANRFHKVKWEDSKYAKGFSETIYSGVNLPLFIVNGRFVFRPEGLAQWLKRQVKKQGFGRHESINVTAMRDALDALGALPGVGEHPVRNSYRISGQRWWILSEELTETLLSHLGLATPDADAVESAQQTLLALEE